MRLSIFRFSSSGNKCNPFLHDYTAGFGCSAPGLDVCFRKFHVWGKERNFITKRAIECTLHLVLILIDDEQWRFGTLGIMMDEP